VPLIRSLFLLLGLGAALAVDARSSWLAPAADAGLLPADEAFQLMPATRQGQSLRIAWNISPGYFLYRQQLQFEVLAPQGFRLAPPRLPAGEARQDPEFGAVRILRGITDAEFVLPPGLRAALRLRVHYQGCADAGVCYPPQVQILDIPAPRT
jgi:thiol:disulfide interchange protein